ncbi:unnamed protein product [Musa acuminata subsp. malaccensis]|uniref:U-box domain-containing protein n=1 Tax=Musa acuminata subsp. malaccensis TaxID=214687 RepID=A0A804J458_MUSAM|nr:PREDICTED: E3 ubiquitin-protein ligase PUB22-like [Musa acuminata subsp. malaccensis]CAG1838414.1 unnamed protein product [Musa acuminata subsp. malaccensis]
MDDASIMFQCPISMEPMEDPVTIATGISYDRECIEKWLFVYKQSTCPVTMRRLPNSDLIPNHTLRRLMSSFREAAGGGPAKPPPRLPDVIDHDELVSLLKNVQTGPFRVTYLRKLRALVDKDVELQKDLIRLGGAQVLGRIMASHGVVEYWDLDDFRDRDEAVGVLALLPLSDEATVELLWKPDCVRSMMEILQSGTAEAQLRTMSILTKASKTNNEWTNTANLLLVGRTARDRRDLEEEPPEGDRSRHDSRLGRDSDGRKCEKVLLLLTRLCKCPEGRSAMADHGLGVAAVSEKILRVSRLATKLGVKILWLMSSNRPTEQLLEEMTVVGSVAKLLALSHIDGQSSTKKRAMRMMKLHGAAWRRYPCVPSDLNDFLRSSRFSVNFVEKAEAGEV